MASLGSLLEYLNKTVPDVVEKSVHSFFYDDPFMAELRRKGRVVRSGGSHVRATRIKSGHSDAVEINSTNLSVPLDKKPTFSTMTGDWGRFLKPIILPKYDLNRMESAAMRKNHIKDVSNAALLSMRQDVCRRIYIGDTASASKFAGIGTLNGGGWDTPGAAMVANTNGTASGFNNGALMYATPTQQGAAGTTYMNEARVEDATDDEDNWYNQYKEFTAIGTDALDAIEETKIRADTYAEQGGITIGILGITDHVALGREIRAYPGGAGNGAIVYTPADLESGKAHKTIHVASGIRFYSNRWMTAAKLADPLTGIATVPELMYLLNPDYAQWWVNAGADFKVTKFADFLTTTGTDALIAFIELECQLALNNLLVQGCVSAPTT